MAGLSYLGKTSEDSQDVLNVLKADTVFGAGMSRTYVSGRAHELALGKAAKTYIDSQDSQYQAVGYSATQNALLVPNSAKGAPNGVASLGSDSKVPVGQVPIMGAGLLRGPYGPVNAVSGTVEAGDEPVKLFDAFNGVTGVNGLILPFYNIMAKTDSGRTVIEVRIGPTGENDYADQVLLGRGVGQDFFFDWQSIEVFPVSPRAGMGQSGQEGDWPAGTSYNIDCWMYDDGGGTSTTQAGYTVTAALYFLLTSL